MNTISRKLRKVINSTKTLALDFFEYQCIEAVFFLFENFLIIERTRLMPIMTIINYLGIHYTNVEKIKKILR